MSYIDNQLSALVAAMGTRTDDAATEPSSTTASGIALLKGLLQPNRDGLVLLESGIITADGHSDDIHNWACRGVKVFIATGAFGTGASAMSVKVQGRATDGVYYDILTSASLVANKDASSASANILTVYPGLTAVNNQVSGDVLPPTWRVAWHASNWGTDGSTLGIVCAMIV